MYCFINQRFPGLSRQVERRFVSVHIKATQALSVDLSYCYCTGQHSGLLFSLSKFKKIGTLSFIICRGVTVV